MTLKTNLFRNNEIATLLDESLLDYTICYNGGFIIKNRKIEYSVLSLSADLIVMLGFGSATDSVALVNEYVQDWFNMKISVFGKPILDYLSYGEVVLSDREWVVIYETNIFSIDSFRKTLDKFSDNYTPKTINYFVDKWYFDGVIKHTEKVIL